MNEKRCDQCGKIMHQTERRFSVHKKDGAIRNFCYFCFAKQIPTIQDPMQKLVMMFEQLNEQVIELAKIVDRQADRIEQLEDDAAKGKIKSDAGYC